MIERRQRDRRAVQIARALLVTVAIGAAWRIVRYALGFPMWGDEAFIVTSLYARGLGDMIRHPALECGQVAPLGFMWAEIAVAKVLGLSERALRLPAFISGLIALALFVRLSRRVLDRRAGLLAVAIFAASYYVVRHATEVKPYAWDLCVSLVITSLAWALYTHRRSPARWTAFIAAAAVGVWLSYTAVFVAGGAAAVLATMLWQDRRKPWGILAGWLCLAITLVGSFAAMYWYYGRLQSQATTYMLEIKTWKTAFPPMDRPWLIPWWLLKVHTGNMTAYPAGGKNFGSTVTFILVAMGCWSMWRGKRRALLAMLLSPLALMFIAAAMKKYPYGSSARVSQNMAPAFCLLAGAGLWWVTCKVHRARRRRQAALLISAGVIAAIAVIGLATDIVRPHKKFSDQTNRDVMRELAGQTKPADRWIIFNSLSPNAGWSQYIHAAGGSGARFRYYVHRLAPADVRWGPRPEEVFSSPSAIRGRTWLIVYRDNKLPFAQARLDAYLRVVAKGLGTPDYRRYVLTSSKDRHHNQPKDPRRRQVEAIDVYRYDPLAAVGGGAG